MLNRLARLTLAVLLAAASTTPSAASTSKTHVPPSDPVIFNTGSPHSAPSLPFIEAASDQGSAASTAGHIMLPPVLIARPTTERTNTPRPPGRLAQPPVRILQSLPITEVRICNVAGDCPGLVTNTLATDGPLVLYAAGYGGGAFEGNTWPVTWTVSSGATVSPTAGVTTTLDGNTPGVAVVTATLITTPTIFTTAALTITPGALNRIVIRDAPAGGGSAVTDSTRIAGTTWSLYAAGYDSDSNFISSPVVTWTLQGSIGSIAPQIGSSTVFTAGATGTGSIRAQYSSTITDTTGRITVIPGAPFSMTLVAKPISQVVGSNIALTATVKDRIGNMVTDGTLVTFISSIGNAVSPRATTGGVATSTVSSTQSGMANVTAFSALTQGTVTSSQAQADYLREVRAIHTAEFGAPNPVGLTFSSAANAFLILEAQRMDQPDVLGSDIVMITLLEDPAGSVSLDTGTAERLNVAFDDRGNSLLIFDQVANELIEVKARRAGYPDPADAVITRFEARQLGVEQAQGMTLDPASGRLFILDAAAPRIVAITPDPEQRFDGTAAAGDGRIVQVDLSGLGDLQPRGVAFNPNNGHVYVLSATEFKLYELSETGEVVSSRDLAPLQLIDPQGMVFAPSVDSTDDPALMNLYIADSGLSAEPGQVQANGRIIELSLTEPVLVDLSSVAVVSATLVRTIDTSQWLPPSPDPAGIAYRPGTGRLLISDSEVEEMPRYWAGSNVFESTTGGTLFATCSTTAFSIEPTGVAINPSNGHIFISDDDARRIFEVNLGADGQYCTADDSVTSVKTGTFNSNDPEGLAYGQGSLFVAGGVDTEVFRIAPGANGIFDGVPPAGDDVVTHFDTASIGQPDPEGIEYNADSGTLYIVSNGSGSDISETTITGTVVNIIDITWNVTAPAGLARAPGSTNAGVMNLYMVDRGVDNNSNPNENDGKLYEISVGSSPPAVSANVVVTFTPGAPFSVTLVASPTAQTVGNGSVLTATVTDRFGNAVIDGTPVTFTASFGSVLSPRLTAKGVATSAISSTLAGAALITASSGSARNTTIITFTPGAPVTLTLAPATAVISAGSRITYTATSKDSYGNAVGDISAGTVFSIPISSGGVFVGNAVTPTVPNRWTVTGTHTSTGMFNRAVLTVTPGAPFTLTLSPARAVISAGVRITYTAVATDAYGNFIGNVTSGTTFTIPPASGGTFVRNVLTPTVANTWAVTGVQGAASSTAVLTVTPAVYAKLSIDKAPAGTGTPITTVIMSVYDTLTAYAVGYDAYNNPLGARMATWAVSGALTGTLWPTTGISTTLTPILSGTGVLTASSGGIADTAGPITVLAPVLQIRKLDSPDPVKPSAALRYTIVYTNISQFAARNVVITETYPASVTYQSASPPPTAGTDLWSIGDLPARATGTITVFVKVANGLPAGTRLTNTVRIGGLQAATAIFTATTLVTSAPALSLSQGNVVSRAAAGDVLTYSLTYANAGNTPAANVVITDHIPANSTFQSCAPACVAVGGGVYSFTLDTVSVGANGFVTLTIQVSPTLPAGLRAITNTARIRTTTIGDDLEDNLAQDVDSISTVPALDLDVAFDSSTPYPTQRVTYTLRYTNTSAMDTTGVVISVTGSPYANYVPSGWTFVGGTVYTRAIGNLAAGATGQATYVISLPFPYADGTESFVNTFLIHDDGPGGIAVATDVETTTLGVPDLVIDSVSLLTSRLSAGLRFTATLVIRNEGTGRACNPKAPGCGVFSVDAFINPSTPPLSFPFNGRGDREVTINPLDPGMTTTVKFTDLSSPTGDSFILYFKVDNQDCGDAAQPCLPASAQHGWVPESDETNNVFGPVPVPIYHLHLPIASKNHQAQRPLQPLTTRR